VRFLKHVGEPVEHGEPLIWIFGHRTSASLAASARAAVTVSATQPAPTPLILSRIDRQPQR
jgi:thymidine phosphorylase